MSEKVWQGERDDPPNPARQAPPVPTEIGQTFVGFCTFVWTVVAVQDGQVTLSNKFLGERTVPVGTSANDVRP